MWWFWHNLWTDFLCCPHIYSFKKNVFIKRIMFIIKYDAQRTRQKLITKKISMENIPTLQQNYLLLIVTLYMPLSDFKTYKILRNITRTKNTGIILRPERFERGHAPYHFASQHPNMVVHCSRIPLHDGCYVSVETFCNITTVCFSLRTNGHQQS